MSTEGIRITDLLILIYPRYRLYLSCMPVSEQSSTSSRAKFFYLGVFALKRKWQEEGQSRVVRLSQEKKSILRA